jgi:hypothetical protein
MTRRVSLQNVLRAVPRYLMLTQRNSHTELVEVVKDIILGVSQAEKSQAGVRKVNCGFALGLVISLVVVDGNLPQVER